MALGQIDFAKSLADDVASGKGFDLDPLIKNLRDDLRKELDLKKVMGSVRWLRFHEN